MAYSIAFEFLDIMMYIFNFNHNSWWNKRFDALSKYISSLLSE